MSRSLDCAKTASETASAINSLLHLSGHDQELLLHVIEDYFDPEDLIMVKKVAQVCVVLIRVKNKDKKYKTH